MIPDYQFTRSLTACLALTILGLAGLLYFTPEWTPPEPGPLPETPRVLYLPQSPHASAEQAATFSPALIALPGALSRYPGTDEVMRAPRLSTAPPSLFFNAGTPRKHDRPVIEHRRFLLPELTKKHTFRIHVPEPRTMPPPPEDQATKFQFVGSDPDQQIDLSHVDFENRENLPRPAGPATVTVYLYFDKLGFVTHALLETPSDQPDFNLAMMRQIYKCRISPVGAAGYGHLQIHFPNGGKTNSLMSYR